MEKWGKHYWVDLAERVGSTLVYSVITALTLTGTTPVDWSDKDVVWAVIGLPTLLALLKGLLVNLKGPEPTASLADVTSGDTAHTQP